MKRLLLSGIIILSFIIFNSCSEKETTQPIDNCEYTIDSRLSDIYECPPNVADCYEGTLAYSEKMKALDRLNYFRRLHNLSEVGYNPDYDEYVQKSALIAVANRRLNHFPNETDECFTPKGDTACNRSNLHLTIYSMLNNVWQSDSSIDGWINERYSASIGHRRWFLCPFLKTVSFGRVDQIMSNNEYRVGTTMYIWDNEGPAESQTEFVACPFGDYPFSAFDTDLILSFSVMSNNSNLWSNSNVNFSNATIMITDENQNSYTITDKEYDNIGYGLPNNLEWRTQGLDYNIKYTVKINNVLVGTETKNYDYWFRIVK
jgi:hypothetical protein